MTVVSPAKSGKRKDQWPVARGSHSDVSLKYVFVLLFKGKNGMVVDVGYLEIGHIQF